MAYALDLGVGAPRSDSADATRPGLFARIMRRMQAAQMARVRRELRLYAPHLEAELEFGETRKVRLSNDDALPFVR